MRAVRMEIQLLLALLPPQQQLPPTLLPATVKMATVCVFFIFIFAYSLNTFILNAATPLAIQTPPPSPVSINSRVPQPGPFSVSVEHPSSMQREPTAANVLPERVWQECVVGGPINQQQQQECNWEFVDPTRRVGCTCSK